MNHLCITQANTMRIYCIIILCLIRRRYFCVFILLVLSSFFGFWLCKMPVFSLIVNIILANACLFVFFFRMVKWRWIRLDRLDFDTFCKQSGNENTTIYLQVYLCAHLECWYFISVSRFLLYVDTSKYRHWPQNWAVS